MEQHPGPPWGITVLANDAERLVLRHRTTGMGCAGCFFVFWLSGWTFFCVQMTIGAFFGNAGINWWLVAASIPFWFGEIVVVHYVLWYFFSSTTLTFRVDEFAIEKSLWRYRNRRVIRRTDVKLVKQIKDGGEDEDSFPSWGLLIVVGDEEINLLTRQPIEKSDWLGPLLAKWAEVEFVPSEPKQCQ